MFRTSCSTIKKNCYTEGRDSKFANVQGYEIGGKTGTADKPKMELIRRQKLILLHQYFLLQNHNLFCCNVRYTKKSKDYVYNYRDGKGG